MSELQVTQCPFCKTHFRLTHEQLHAAAGHVRCGACLKVFNALPQPTAVEQPAAPAQPAPSPQDAFLIHDDLELDELDLEALGLDESILDEINPPAAGSPPPASGDVDPADDVLPARSETDTRIETSLDALIADEPDLDESFLATPPARDIGPLRASRATDDDTSPASAQAGQHRPVTPDDQSLAVHSDDDTAARRDRREPAVSMETAPATHSAHPEREPAFGDLLHLPELEDEPLPFDDAPLSRRRARHNWLWGILCLLAIAALITQAALYNLEAWARNAQLRPLLENVCLVAGCRLPARVDISQIRSSNLLVRPHPEFPNTLDINLIVYNRADFDQPFPVIRMAFSDSRGRIIATRDFRPTEYLAGELAGRSLMPSQTPIHIALSMVAPGQQATSYQLDFVAP